MYLTLYSKKNCSYCTQAKDFLNRQNVAFKVVDIDADTSARDFIVGRGHRTVPQIYKGETLFVDGGFIGLLGVAPEKFKEFKEELANA